MGKHLLFLTRATGYELVERDGDPPALGDAVELDGEGRFVVSKVAQSPFPDDDRISAYQQTNS